MEGGLGWLLCVWMELTEEYWGIWMQKLRLRVSPESEVCFASGGCGWRSEEYHVLYPGRAPGLSPGRGHDSDATVWQREVVWDPTVTCVACEVVRSLLGPCSSERTRGPVS